MVTKVVYNHWNGGPDLWTQMFSLLPNITLESSVMWLDHTHTCKKKTVGIPSYTLATNRC